MRVVRNPEGGATLIEILMAISILGIGIVALVSGMFTSIVASDHNIKQSTAEATTRAFAEFIKRQPYTNCSGGYGDTGMVFPAGFDHSASMRYWNPVTGTFESVCSIPDSGIQKVIVSVSSSDGFGSASLEVVKRRASLS